MDNLLFKESPFLSGAVIGFGIVGGVLGHIWISIISIIVLIFLLYFYRYAEHETNYNDQSIISPAEGLLQRIWQDDQNIYIAIFLSPLNRHYQLYPVNGRVIDRVYDETGKFNLAMELDKSDENEKKIHWISMQNGRGVLTVTQIAGFLPRRIVSDDSINCDILAGQYMGMIKFGSRVDLCIPKQGFTLNVIEGDNIKLTDLIGTYAIN